MNALALNTVASDSGLLPPRRAAGAYLTEIRFEFTRMLRNPAFAIPVVLVPLALYLLFAVVIFGEAVTKDPNTGIFFFSAFSVMAVTMPALFGISASLAMEREMGLMKLKRAQPAPPGSWLVAKITVGIFFCMLSYLPMLAAALFTGSLPLDTGQVVAMSLALILGSIPFCALGLMVGALVKGSAAPGYANLLYLPGLYLSGMFWPMPAYALAGALLAAVPRQPAGDARRGRHQVPVHLRDHGHRRVARLHRAVQRRRRVAPRAQRLKTSLLRADALHVWLPPRESRG